MRHFNSSRTLIGTHACCSFLAFLCRFFFRVCSMILLLSPVLYLFPMVHITYWRYGKGEFKLTVRHPAGDPVMIYISASTYYTFFYYTYITRLFQMFHNREQHRIRITIQNWFYVSYVNKTVTLEESIVLPPSVECPSALAICTANRYNNILLLILKNNMIIRNYNINLYRIIFYSLNKIKHSN